MTPAQQIAQWADKLRDISAMGHHFATNIYDRENYEAIQEIAVQMFALATGQTLEAIEPLKATLMAHATPFAVGDAAVIDDNGRILLIQRADNGCWAMPGGALNVGETPAAGVVREAHEETGVSCEAVQLVGVFDSRLCGSVMAHHLYQFVFLCRPLNGGQLGTATHTHEVLDVAWFAEDALPTHISPGHVTRIPEAFRVWRGDKRPFFDKQ